MTLIVGCGSSAPSNDPAMACEDVGIQFCMKAYACLTPDEIAGYQLPATEADCVTEENTNCGAAVPQPGYCKSGTQTSADAAHECAGELTGLTCDMFKMPTSSGACKTLLCTSD